MTDDFVGLGIMRVRGSRLLKILRRERRSGRVACWRCGFDGVVLICSGCGRRGIYFLEVSLVICGIMPSCDAMMDIHEVQQMANIACWLEEPECELGHN